MKAVEKLTDIVWPSIRFLAEEEIEELKKNDREAIVVLEAAVLIEAGWETIGTETWVIEVNSRNCSERIILRNQISRKRGAVED